MADLDKEEDVEGMWLTIYLLHKIFYWSAYENTAITSVLGEGSVSD